MNSESRLAPTFDLPAAGTIGAEEELMLLSPGELDLVPRAEAVIEALGGDRRFKRELPAAQIESTTTPCRTVGELVAQLAASRRDLSAATRDLVEIAAAGTHPFARPLGELNRGARYDRVVAQYGWPVLARQLVFALQIHVAPGSAEAALPVYNALRSYLPEIAALAANAPFHDGADAGHASIRPRIAELLPRQGVPPALADWDEFEASLEWGRRAGVLPDHRSWWWELRPHRSFGTLELRVPDAQTTVAEAGAVAAFAQSLVTWLAERHRAGEGLAVHASWRIAENRWLAARDGLDAQLIDLDDGRPKAARERIEALIDRLAPIAERLDCGPQLADAAALAARNGAVRQREVAGRVGVAGVVVWLRERFLAGCEAQLDPSPPPARWTGRRYRRAAGTGGAARRGA